MTPEQKAYASLFYEGLIQRLKVEAARVEHGEESTQHAVASAQLEANVALAHESIREIEHPLSQAAWKGFLGGVQRYAGVGGPTFPREIEETQPERPNYNAVQLMYAELDGWMPDFYEDLPWCIDMIKRGARSLAKDDEHIETWAFFESLVEGITNTSGNFGDGFTDRDRVVINQYVNGVWELAAQLVQQAIDLPDDQRPRPIF